MSFYYAFSIENHKIEQYRYKESDKFYEEYDLLAQEDDGETLNQLQSNLTKIEMEISNLDSRLNDLRALKQLIVSRLHKIAKDNFEEEFERKILHTIVGDSPKSVSELANKLNEKQSNVTKTLHRMNKKLYGNEHGHKALFTEKRTEIRTAIVFTHAENPYCLVKNSLFVS